MMAKTITFTKTESGKYSCIISLNTNNTIVSLPIILTKTQLNALDSLYSYRIELRKIYQKKTNTFLIYPQIAIRAKNQKPKSSHLGRFLYPEYKGI